MDASIANRPRGDSMRKQVYVLMLVCMVVASSNLIGQQETAPETTDSDVSENNRLPPGFSEIITNSQKRKIYKIQQSYQSQIDALRSQIEAIESKRDAEVSAILDDEQKEVLKFILKIRERNRNENEQDSADSPSPAEETPAAAQ